MAPPWDRVRSKLLLLWIAYAGVLLFVVLTTGFAGLIFGYALDLPQVDRLQQVGPSVVSYVYSEDGEVLGEFALERRTLVTYDQIPETLRNAILAAEDSSFFEHTGFDVSRILVSAIRDILHGERKGGSTLTMQLSKLVFTSPEKTLKRKIQDVLFAIEIEKNFSKEQIFSFYCNQIYMGHGIYGVAAAADFYFQKRLDELTVAQSAILAGITPSPTRFSPINYPERALQRQRYTLRRMFEEGSIDAKTLRLSLEESIQASGKNLSQDAAPYFVEWVRQHLEQRYSTDQIWKGGLRVQTPINYDWQLRAQEKLREGLKKFDRETRPWEGAERNILSEGETLESFLHPDWRLFFFPGQLVHGLVLESNPESALVKLGSYRATITPKEIEWTQEEHVDAVLKKGDVSTFEIRELDSQARTISATLERVPEVQGALLAIENQTGAIKAMVGGFDFHFSQFNRSTQALRQPGSIFKPFTYVAAIETDFDPGDLLSDQPVHYLDPTGRVYSPENWDHRFKGPITVEMALAESRNVPTLQLANLVGIERVVDMAHRFGIQRNFPPVLPIAIGAGELTLEEITSAFSAFPNYGVRAKTYFIEHVEDYNGIALEEHQPEVEEVISRPVAEKMVAMLRTVVEQGSGRRARALGRPVAGKTGTTDDSTDSWFVGFTPELTVGVWVGYDERKTLGDNIFGANLALPIWVDFMQAALEEVAVSDFEFIEEFSPGETLADSAGGAATAEGALAEGAITSEDIGSPSTRNR